jgi:hypothetical protein
MEGGSKRVRFRSPQVAESMRLEPTPSNGPQSTGYEPPLRAALTGLAGVVMNSRKRKGAEFPPRPRL